MVDDTSFPQTLPGTGVRTSLGPYPFPDVYRREMPLLTRFVMKHGAGPQEAADAAQEAFATAYPVWDSIRFPARWLRTVAVRVYFRAKLREDLPGELPATRAESHVPTSIQLSDQEREVYAALVELPSRQRQVMAWFYDGYTLAEIAEELGITKEAVRQNLCRARATLKAGLGQRGGA
ncbi:sigma-70 family RNA polymerase sigma factor [Streptomyces sp. NBC_00335]|uniref:RNA polymerase sigma factor n=1 Tax=unclassified Streptomyces TaxID=2593676 RepID=UPI00225848B7|nr:MULTISPECIES: sigma-70 family RNA polymerase sigma factor [unclassified Streptomyces]MCX5409872.1 sigma-70 family RNA polymerase sigma factor [Streptomyces sp. NBC_00086]